MAIHDISLEKAADLTRNYREENGLDESKGFYFEKAKIEALLEPQDCTGIRIYYGKNIFKEDKLVIVGVTGNPGNEPQNLNDKTTNIAEYGISTAVEPDNSSPFSALARDQQQ